VVRLEIKYFEKEAGAKAPASFVDITFLIKKYIILKLCH